VEFKLASGETIGLTVTILDHEGYTCSCAVRIRNMLGMPIKRIVTIGLSDVSRGCCVGPWEAGNLIRVDFDEIPHPVVLMAGYIAQFHTIEGVRKADGQHGSLFGLGKTLKLLSELGWLRRNED